MYVSQLLHFSMCIVGWHGSEPFKEKAKTKQERGGEKEEETRRIK